MGLPWIEMSVPDFFGANYQLSVNIISTQKAIAEHWVLANISYGTLIPKTA